MNYRLIILFVILLTIPGCSDNSKSKVKETADIKWESFDAGISKAKEQKKLIVIDFYADWCYWCKVMDRETFSDKEVVQIIKKHFIAIRIDTEKGEKITYKGMTIVPNGFATMLGVRGLPTVAFMDKDANFIDKVPGFIAADIFIGILRYISEGCYKLQVSFADYMNKKVDCK